MLKLTERDKMLLLLLAIVAIIGGSWYFGYRNLARMTEEVKVETETLVAKYNSLSPLYDKREEYAAQTKELEKKFDEVLSSFPTGTTQEGMIVLAKHLEEKTDIWNTSLGISDILPVYTFGKVTSSNPNTLGAMVYSTDMTGHKTTLTMSCQGTYGQTKDLIQYINENEGNQFVIENISMGYADGQVSSTITLANYDITGYERPYSNVKVFDVPLSTSNMFVSRISSLASTSSIISNYDMFVTVLPFVKGEESVIAGLDKDVYHDTALIGRGNSLHNVTFVVSGTNGNYKISYKVGDEMYPAENYFDGVDFECGDTIDLLVLSSARTAKEDKVSVKINITNSSDKTVNLFVFGDDEKDPRVALGTTTGSVNVEN